MSGVIQRYEAKVPNGYQEVEYIENTGTTQYIDTGWKRDFSKNIEIETAVKITTLGKRYCIISDYAGQYSYNFSLEINNSDLVRLFVRSGTNEMVNPNPVSNVSFSSIKYTFNAATLEGVVFVDGVSSSITFTSDVADRKASVTDKIFIDNDMRYSTFNNAFQLKKMAIKENGTLVRNFIPVKRTSDNELGLYDTVNDVFYTNQGTGTFTSGSDIEVWHDIPYTKLETATDTLSALPVTTYNDGTSATVAIKGNMQQSGTPTPSSPITPSECGERTVQLFDKDNAIMDKEIDGFSYKMNTDYYITNFIPVTSGETYSKNADIGTSLLLYHNADFNETVTQKISLAGNGSFTIPEGYNYIVGNGRKSIINSAKINKGSELLPYEPYGYKLPIVSGGVTTNAYLGEVQSTRKIKKIVFTGNETINSVTAITGGYRFSLAYDFSDMLDRLDLIASHFIPSNSWNTINAISVTNAYNGAYIMLPDSMNISTTTEFSQWLADQYAAGTPVTVWYVLATETTGIVNEPIRKIGDYADSVSVTNIPTTTGGQTFDVDTTLKPSEVDLTYHGWHEHEPLKRENGSWT